MLGCGSRCLQMAREHPQGRRESRRDPVAALRAPAAGAVGTLCRLGAAQRVQLCEEEVGPGWELRGSGSACPLSRRGAKRRSVLRLGRKGEKVRCSSVWQRPVPPRRDSRPAQLPGSPLPLSHRRWWLCDSSGILQQLLRAARAGWLGTRAGTACQGIYLKTQITDFFGSAGPSSVSLTCSRWCRAVLPQGSAQGVRDRRVCGCAERGLQLCPATAARGSPGGQEEPVCCESAEPLLLPRRIRWCCQRAGQSASGLAARPRVKVFLVAVG